MNHYMQGFLLNNLIQSLYSIMESESFFFFRSSSEDFFWRTWDGDRNDRYSFGLFHPISDGYKPTHRGSVYSILQ